MAQKFLPDENQLSPTELTETRVRESFESLGWTVDKLDLGKVKAADYRICRAGACFLCEVKTIESVHSNLPWAPSIEVFRTRRRERQIEIEKWKTENQGSQLVMNPKDYEFVFGNEAEFAKKYRGRDRYTEDQFNEFRNSMREYLLHSQEVMDLPYSLRLDSDDLYVPYGNDREQFFTWLKEELLAIHAGNPNRNWHIDKIPQGDAANYWMHHVIHEPIDENDYKSVYQLNINGPKLAGALDVQIFSYGSLNLDAIKRNIDAGLGQLHASADQEEEGILQVIALGFASGLSFEWDELLPYLSWLLKENPALAAIAVVDRVPDGEPSPQAEENESLLTWLSSGFAAPWVTRFVVIHNTWHLERNDPLLESAFSSEYDVHLAANSIEMPQSWQSEEQ